MSDIRIHHITGGTVVEKIARAIDSVAFVTDVAHRTAASKVDTLSRSLAQIVDHIVVDERDRADIGPYFVSDVHRDTGFVPESIPPHDHILNCIAVGSNRTSPDPGLDDNHIVHGANKTALHGYVDRKSV